MPNRLLSAAALVALAAGSFASAQTNRTWVSGTATGNWSDTAVWTGGLVPDSLAENAVFGADTVGRTVTLDTSIPVNGVTIIPRTSGFNGLAFTLNQGSSSVLSIDAGGLLIGNGGTAAINVPITLTASQVWNGGSDNPSGSANFTNTVSGAFQITRTATNNGAFTFSGNNTFSGGFINTSGTTRIGVNPVLGSALTSSAIGTGTLALNGGTLSSNGTTARAIYNSTLLGGNAALGNSTDTGALTFQTDPGFATPATFNLSSANNGTIRTLTVNSAVTINLPIGEAGGGTRQGLAIAGTGTFSLGTAKTFTGDLFAAAGSSVILNSASAANQPGDAISFGGILQATGANRLVSGYVGAEGGELRIGDLTNLTGVANSTSLGLFHNSRISSTSTSPAQLDDALDINSNVSYALTAASSIAFDQSTLGDGKAGLAVGTTGTLAYTGTLASGSDNTFRVSGGLGTLSFTATTLTGAGKNVLVQSGGTVSISGNQNYDGTTTVNGALTLSGANGALSATSGITVNNTTLSLDNATNSGSRLNDSAALTLNRATLSATTAAGNAALAETLGAITFSAGVSTVSLTTTPTANDRAYTIASLARANAAAALFRGDAFGAPTAGGNLTGRNALLVTAAPSGANFVGGYDTADTTVVTNRKIIPWAIGGGSSSSIGGTFVTYDASTGSLRNLLTASEYTTLALSADPTDNIREVRAASATILTANSTKTVNSFILNNAAATGTVTSTLGSSAVLTVTSGALQFNQAASQAITLTGGTIAFGSAPGVVTGTGGGFLNTLSSALTGSAGVSVHATSAAISLNGANSVTGGVTISSQGGNFIGLSNDSAFGPSSNAVTFAGGTLRLFGIGINNTTRNFVLLPGVGDNTFDLNSGSAVAYSLGGGSGLISGAGRLRVASSGSTANSLTLASANTYSGGTQVDSGILIASNDAALGTGSVVVNSASLAFTSAAPSIGALYNTSQTGSNAVVTLGNANTSSTALTIGANNDSGIFIGTIAESAAGRGSLVKTGTGTQVLTGAHTYTGNTTVGGGTLVVTGSLASATTTVQTGATLSLVGGVAQALTVNTGGLLTGSGTVGNTTVNGAFAPAALTLVDATSLTLASGSSSTFTFTSPAFGPGSFGRVTGGTGTSATFGGTLALNFSGTGYAIGANVARIFNVASTAGSFATVTVSGLPTNLSATFNSATGFVSIIDNTAPPEPNVAPTLPTQADRSVAALSPLTVTNTGADTNTPAQTLSYQLTVAPSGATISASGVITWTPAINQVSETPYTFTTVVTDSGSPALTATNSFAVTVTAYFPPPNQSPVLPAQTNRTLVVGAAALSVNNAATDADLPAQTLTYELLQAPAGASIGPDGLITWAPTADDVSATPYTIETRVTDDGTPALSATNTFTVTVNAPPSGGQALTFDLQTTGQFAANFRTLSAIGAGTAAQTDLSGVGVFRQDSTSGNTAAAYLYDTTPADATTGTDVVFSLAEGPLTVAFDARTAVTDTAASPSFAVMFADPANLNSNNVTAVFNLKTGVDQVRFFRDGAPVTNAGVGTQVGTSQDVTTIAEPGTAFTSVSYRLSVVGTTPTLTITVGANTYTSAFSAGDFNWTGALVILRLNDGSTATGTMDIDNITITPSVAQTNVAPTLSAQADRSVASLDTLLVANTATDTNTPAQTLTYQLTTAPAGATISAGGVITWTPSPAQVSATPYTFTTVVTDSGTPALTATNTFQVTATAAPVFAYSQSVPFTTASDLTANFRTLSALGGGTLNVVNGALAIDARSSGGNTSAVLLYDRTPEDTSAATQTAFPTNQQVRVSFLARAATTGSGFTVSFADPANANNRVSAQFLLNTGNDIVRFHRDGAITATTFNSGTQVGTDATFDSGAEPASGTFIPVTVIFTVNGTTPTLTVTAGGAAAVTSAFVAGDCDWSSSLVLLRFVDPSTAAGPLELSNLLVAGGTPVTPPAPTYAPAPGADGNLLTVNGGFEATGSLTYTSAGAYNASYTVLGWSGFNFSYGQTHGISSGTVAAGTTTEGTRKIVQREGGYLLTATTARAQASPGLVYELRQDQRVTRRTYPSEKLGSIRTIEFFDSAGIRLKTVWGTESDYKVQYQGTLNTWETFTLRAVAPPNTAAVGVRLDNPSGRFVSNAENYVVDRDVELDNIRLTVVAESVDRLGVRRAPRLVEPGKTVTLKLNHATLAARTLRVALLDATGTERATGSVAMATGRFRATPVSLALPANLPDGSYSWKIELRPTSVGPAVAALAVPGVIIDQSVAAPTAVNGTDFDADHARIQFMGRVENTNPKQQWLHWFGSEVRVRFSGTALTLRGTMTDNGFGGAESTNVQVIIDENFSSPITVTLNSFNFVKSLVSGLPDGVHTARIFKANETDISIRVDGFRVDAGRGLLVPEPLPNRRIEIFGDSVTSGGTASPGFNGYSSLIGRELDADVHIVSKGGTGVAASFSNQDILVNYYDNLSFPNVFNASSSGSLPWDFNRWTADVVICAIGHNDQFNNGLATFTARYAEFKGYIRTAYPNAPFITANTLISANLGQFQNAIDPLLPADPLLSFAFQPNTWSDSATGHPPTAGHAAQIYGDERRYSLADLVEDRAGWAFSASTPASAYDQWVAASFTTGQITQGLHLPAVDADFDGLSNFLEFALGGNPTDPSSAPKFSVAPGAVGSLNFAFFRARADVSYVVERSGNLIDWSTFSTNPGSVGGVATLTDTIVPGEKTFYRLRTTQP